MSVLNDILDSAVTAVTALNLQLNTVVIPVVKRKLPKKEETVDPATQFAICMAEQGETYKRLSFGSGDGHHQVQVTYPLEITLLTPNLDQSTNLDVEAGWREKVRNLFKDKTPFATVLVVYATRIVQGKWLDRKQITNNYDDQQVRVEVITSETV